MANEPMTDEQLQQIRSRVDDQVATQVEAEYLLAEVDRLRTREVALRSHLPRFLYPFESPFTCDPCPWCHCSQDYEPHAPDCPVTKARALLAQE